MSDAGRLTGLVGDLTLGFTNPVPLVLALMGGGFLTVDDTVPRVAEVAAVRVAEAAEVLVGTADVSFLGTVRVAALTGALVAWELVAEVGVLTEPCELAVFVVVFVAIVLGRVEVFLFTAEPVAFGPVVDPELASPFLGFASVMPAGAVAMAGSAGSIVPVDCS